MNNPARPWYERLGFREAGEFGVYVLMRRSPVS
jgi:predicted GNAT family acetyltransferase